MPNYFVQYHRVSVSEGIDTETDISVIGAEVNSDISQRCKQCWVLLYINKSFKKDQKKCNICYDLLNDERESGSIQIVQTWKSKILHFYKCLSTLCKKINWKRTAYNSIRLSWFKWKL